MTPVSRNEPRDQLAALLAEQLYDRGEYVADWPEDERELHRNGFPDAWTDFRSRTEAVQKLRYKKAADAVIAFTGGWRPPPRVIETAEELDALPELAVIRTDEGRVFEKVGSFPDPDQFGYRSDWMGMDSEFTLGTDEIDDLPATVLWSPEEPK